jgi:CTP:molybdopterin cytidylyltransferase MocA
VTPPRVGAVVLAAGGSTRLGRPKQLVTLHGEALVRRAARAALEAGAAPVVVVVGAGAAEVRAALAGLPDVDVVENADWADGMASSLAAGLRVLEHAGVAGALLTLADQPRVQARDLSALLAAFAAGAGVAAAEYAGTVGAPAVVGRARFAELLALRGDRGAGGWLRGLGSAVTRVPVPGAAFDVDTPEDVARLAAPP